MITRIVNPKYTYVPGGVASCSATFEIVADDGVTVLTSRGLGCQCELTAPDFRQQIVNAFATQSKEHLDQFVVVAGLVRTLFPASVTFDDAMQEIVTEAMGVLHANN